jgi:hypothetical protein
MACATISVVGADNLAVTEEAMREVLVARQYRVSQIEHRTLTGAHARAHLKKLGVKVDKRSEHTLQITDLKADHDNGQARMSIVDASVDVFKPADKVRVDRLAGTAHWGAGRRQVDSWCFNYFLDGDDPDCASELMSDLVSLTRAAAP